MQTTACIAHQIIENLLGRKGAVLKSLRFAAPQPAWAAQIAFEFAAWTAQVTFEFIPPKRECCRTPSVVTLMTMKKSDPSRRKILSLGASLAALSACSKQEAPSMLGAPMTKYGSRSPHVTAERSVPMDTKTPSTGASRTPLQDTYGIITPSSLHFERHHAGVPDIDPAKHELLIHGLVEQPLVYTLDDLKRFPASSHIYFVECSGNSGSEYSGNPAPDPQQSHGLASCSEWTGVPVKLLLAEAKLKPEAKWVIAEGADACKLTRSIPVEKLLDDAMIVYAQNGEPIRPEQGFPMRLLLPGWEGNANIKWLRRLNATDGPAMTAHETAYYTDLMPDGKARQFSFELEAKSVITRPAGGQKMPGGPGTYEITGLAWSGRGKITRVEVSTDGGRTWKDAELSQPQFAKAFTRFRMPWTWDGQPTSLQSRCTDETGYLQPTQDELLAARGRNYRYHNNGVKVWYVRGDGSVSHVAQGV
jgi:sulfane dehydrogenase subunit SoxC